MAAQAGLCETWLETLKTGLICNREKIGKKNPTSSVEWWDSNQRARAQKSRFQSTDSVCQIVLTKKCISNSCASYKSYTSFDVKTILLPVREKKKKDVDKLFSNCTTDLRLCFSLHG